ncbi:MAG: AAA-like domain-containing protein [Cyanobacteria bacterium J06623_1]
MSEYQVGGSLSVNAATYVVRQADDDLLEALLRDEFCYVFNCRQMGKSSLRVRAKNRLEQQGVACVSIDMTNIGSQSIAPLQWYKSISSEIWRGLNLMNQFSLKQWWQKQADLTPIQHLHLFISDLVLPQVANEKIVIFIDEIDSILSLEFNTDDFFALIRYFYNARAEHPEFSRLSFALFGVATPSELIGDSSRTPFNIGTAIALSGFTQTESQPLIAGLEDTCPRPQIVLREILNWTGGQPFLTQKLCRMVKEQAIANPDYWQLENERQGLKNLVQQQIIDNWEAQDEPEHLKTIRDRILRNKAKANRLLGLSEEIQRQGSILLDDSPEQRDLLLSNLVVKQNGKLVFRNLIYQQIFNLDWLGKQQAKLNPFDKEAELWLDSAGQDKSRLLRGKALQEAQAWASVHSISQSEYQFLTASQEQEQLAVRQKLDLARLQEIETRLLQEQKLAKTQRFLLSTIGAALVVTSFLSVMVWDKFSQATINEIKALSSFSQSLFVSDHRFEALLTAIEATEKNQLSLGHHRVQEATAQAESALRQAVYGASEYNRLSGNLGAVFAVDFSPDDQMIATAGEDKILRLWQPDGVLLNALEGHRARIWDIEFSPDGKVIATASRDHTVKLWSPDGQEILTLVGHQDAVLAVAFSPNGKVIASASRDRTIKLWNRNGQLLDSIEAHAREIHDLAFSPQSLSAAGILVTASNDRTVKLWQVEQNKIQPQPQRIIDLFQDDVRAVAFNPNGRTFAVGSNDGKIRLFDLNGKIKRTLTGHQGAISKLEYSTDGKILVSVSWDRTIQIWQSNGNPIKTITDNSQRLWGLTLSRDGRTLATAGERHGVKLWQVQNPLLTRFRGHRAAAIDVAHHPRQDIIASASDDQTIKLTDSQGMLLATWKGRQNGVLGLAYSPDGNSLVSGHNDGNVRLWQISAREPTKVTKVINLLGHRALVWRIAFSPDGQMFATASEDNTIKIWNPRGKLLQTLEGHQDGVRSVAFSPDSQLIASGSLDNTIRLWNLQGELLTTLKGHQGAVVAVDFYPVAEDQGYTLASASWDSTGKIWRIKPDEQSQYIGTVEKELEGHEDGLRGVNFSPDGQTIATASRDRSIRLWQRDGTLLKTLFGHDGAVWQVDFAPQGKTIVSASEDHTVIVWDLERINQLDLLAYSCKWVKDYLDHNPDGENRNLCREYR